MKQIPGQISLFDWKPTAQEEPDIGAWVEKPGAVIPHIMRRGYIGKKVLINMSTDSMRIFKVGILEDVIPDHYYHLNISTGEYERRTCDRSIIYTGQKQRSLLTHMPGHEIHEVLPWDAYTERMERIGYRGRHT